MMTDRAVRDIPWTRLECGVEAYLHGDTPVCLRFTLAQETPTLLTDARLELFMRTGHLVSMEGRTETSGGLVTLKLRIRGGRHAVE